MPDPELSLLFLPPLNRLGVKYVISGSVAAILYGEPRLTHDVDFSPVGLLSSTGRHERHGTTRVPGGAHGGGKSKGVARIARFRPSRAHAEASQMHGRRKRFFGFVKDRKFMVDLKACLGPASLRWQERSPRVRRNDRRSRCAA